MRLSKALGNVLACREVLYKYMVAAIGIISSAEQMDTDYFEDSFFGGPRR